VEHESYGAPSFEDLVRVEYPSLLRTADLIVGDAGLAREITQETFARAFTRWSRLQHYDKPGAWLRTVGVRQAVRARGRRRREVTARDDEPAPAPADQAVRLDVEAAVRSLPRGEREVVVLHYLHDLPVVEVAEC
jgi:RNA polymerase sigma-70 factor (ECF subfamily)